ncbi:hypothetical protein [Brevibacillus choshinensis]|uniref:hypothetical protein n=1 Tax=Brevibacillus choshinensis TaxID=54911 RepID=UPI002E1FC620|nr:hypothetical protein [Brevibacillus choshinensis]
MSGDRFDDIRVYNEDGTIGHAEVRIGDSVVMMFDAKEEWPDTPSFLRLYFEDGDAVYQQALQAGATPVVRDPLGNIWWIQTRIEDLTPEEMAMRAGQSKYIEAMRYVQGSLRLTPSTQS